ncbi:hypothetical protein CTP10_R44380 [Cupriavidus sp. P-10]|uniref:LysR substrate-binding domain-containing protein n=1 Tax=Cupriavidus sp. P-10 TaxID=2027911 RepID=UPI000EE52F1B|nr:LysR substrate-binding domain-containing protein [Cupriavidus sp. P-10]BDB27033.1 hypothetical protein CTP10_R44380 [Cupriavidus sp. P-10]
MLVTPRSVKSLEALQSTQQLKTIVFRLGCSYRQRLEGLLAQAGIRAATPLEFGSLDAILACVAGGIGVTLLPRGVVAAAQDTIAIHALPPEISHVETLFIRRRDAYVSSAMLAFIQAARSGFGALREAA